MTQQTISFAISYNVAHMLNHNYTIIWHTNTSKLMTGEGPELKFHNMRYMYQK